MIRIVLAITLGVALGAGGRLPGQSRWTRATGRSRSSPSGTSIETLDGKEARVTTVEVAYEPGEAGQPHRHPGPIFGYVLEGELELGLGDQPAKTLKAGETFYEPTGILHRVSRNPSTKTRTRVLAVILHPRDAKDIVLPASAGPTE